MFNAKLLMSQEHKYLEINPSLVAFDFSGRVSNGEW